MPGRGGPGEARQPVARIQVLVAEPAALCAGSGMRSSVSGSFVVPCGGPLGSPPRDARRGHDTSAPDGLSVRSVPPVGGVA